MPSIVLARQDIGEFDQLIDLFSDQLGYIQLLARGIKHQKSKNTAQLLPGMIVDVQIIPTRGSHDTIGSVHVDYSCPYIYYDFVRLKILQDILHTLLQIGIHGGEQESLYTDTYKMIVFLNTVDTRSIQTLAHAVTRWWHRMIAAEGFAFEIHTCVMCGEVPEQFIYGSIHHGGVLCANCGPKARENDSTYIQGKKIEELRLFFLKKDVKGGDIDITRVYTILHRYGQYHFERPFPHILHAMQLCDTIVR